MAQWIVIDKATEICVGVHNFVVAPVVDLDKFDVEQHPDGTIQGEPAEKFRRDGQGNIVLRPQTEIDENYPEEASRRDWAAERSNIPDNNPLKSPIVFLAKELGLEV